LALTLSPVLCLLLFKRLKPGRDNFLVRGLKAAYLWLLQRCLNHRAVTLGAVGVLLLATALALPPLGREFMPQVEGGNSWIRGIFPVNVSLDEVARKTRLARAVIRKYPEVELVACQMGRPDAGTDPVGFYSAEFFVPLLPQDDWPVPPGRTRPRTKAE